MQLSNKQIGKNAFFLYVRMLVILVISLYTSRIILEKLGGENYGIYNLIGGIITIFTILRGAFSGATQRFLNIAIGKKMEDEVKTIFNMSSFIYLIVGVLFILLVETLGLWLLHNKLVIPADRINAAFWVFQISAFSVFLSILTVPYDAIIIAHQKMSFYAFISIVDVILRLVLLYLIFLFPIDKLITYTLLILVSNILIRIVYIYYSRISFVSCTYSRCFKVSQMKELSVFAGWNVLGIFTFGIVSQGMNILLNIFGGVVLNAAQGIANQVNNGIMNFQNNIILAFKPHLIELYAQNKKEAFYNQLLFSCKCNIIMFLLLALPVYVFVKQILSIWLTNIPDYTIEFILALLFYSLIRSFHNPIEIIFISSGRLNRYQQIESTILFCSLPISYIFLKMDFPYYVIFIVMGVIEFINLAAITIYAYFTHKFPLREWSLKVFFPSLFTYFCLMFLDSVLYSVLSKIVLLLFTDILLVMILTSKDERRSLKELIYSKIRRV